MAEDNKPKAPVRRFDVFAEYSRLKGLKEGMPEDEAEGYGLWVAKVVASRGFGRGLSSPVPKPGEKRGEAQEAEQPEEPKPKWHSLGDEEQTDELFEREIVKRMGKDFYYDVFQPAIRQAFDEGRTYQSIRDTIRKEWKP